MSSKWRKRLEQSGSAGLASQSRRPHPSPKAVSPQIVRLVVQIRRRLAKRKVSLVGARAIRRELHSLHCGKHEPSLAATKRILHERGLSIPPRSRPMAFFPKSLVLLDGTLQALDRTCRYLEDGPKVYALHTLNLRTRANVQTIANDKSGATVLAHCMAVWKILGIPNLLQIDNHAAFCGGYKVPRVLGRLVRGANCQFSLSCAQSVPRELFTGAVQTFFQDRPTTTGTMSMPRESTQAIAA